MPEPIFYRDVALRLLKMGWPPIPLHPTSKKPAIKWGGRNVTLPDKGRIGWEARKFGGYSCGIAVAPNVVAVDLDITDWPLQREVIAQVKITLGRPAMIRVGSPPKLMLFYGAAGDMRSMKMHPIELFCGTGQIAAFGIHPKTAQPYEWKHGRSPLVLSPSQLNPVITSRQVDAFLARAEPLLRSLRAARIGSLPATLNVPKASPSGRRLSSNPDIIRLREIINANGGKIGPAVEAVIAEIGTRGTGRHDFLVALTGYLVAHRWPASMIKNKFLPAINAAFSGGDWHDEFTRMIEHALGQQIKKFQNIKNSSGGFNG